MHASEQDALAHALQHHQAGRRVAAETLYREILGRDPENPTALYLYGHLQFESGAGESAIGLLQRVVTLRPEIAAGRIALARLLAATGNEVAALGAYRAAIALAPGAPGLGAEVAAAQRGALARVRQLLLAGRPGEASEALERIGERALPGAALRAEAWFLRGRAAKALHDFPTAIAAYRQALEADPDLAAAWLDLGNCCSELGQSEEAEPALARAVAIDPGLKEAHASLGSVLLYAGREAEAERCYRRALEIDSEMVVAHQNLAAIAAAAGRASEAKSHRDAAYRKQSLFIERAGRAELSVLMPTTAEGGNVPTKFLFPRDRCTVIKWFIEYAGPGDGDRLPPFDLVFNGIGDPDAAAPAEPALLGFLAGCRKPVLNSPLAVRPTRRDRLGGLLEGIPDVVVPEVRRLDPPFAGAAKGEIPFPALLRPLGSHGGAGVRIIRSQAELAAVTAAPGQSVYLSRFWPYRSADGWFRKYRIVFVGDAPYPYHLAISPRWLVHYVTADMLSDPAKRSEEERFLADPEAAIGARAMAAIRAVGARLGLDFAGIDFSLLPDGRVLVFEANATMLVHPEPEPGPFAWRNEAVARILAAFAAMVRGRVAPAPEVGAEDAC